MPKSSRKKVPSLFPAMPMQAPSPRKGNARKVFLLLKDMQPTTQDALVAELMANHEIKLYARPKRAAILGVLYSLVYKGYVISMEISGKNSPVLTVATMAHFEQRKEQHAALALAGKQAKKRAEAAEAAALAAQKARDKEDLEEAYAEHAWRTGQEVAQRMLEYQEARDTHIKIAFGVFAGTMAIAIATIALLLIT